MVCFVGAEKFTAHQHTPQGCTRTWPDEVTSVVDKTEGCRYILR